MARITLPQGPKSPAAKPGAYPSAGNTTGGQGGFPGHNAAGNGSHNVTKAAPSHHGESGSGHVRSEAMRSSTTGYKAGGPLSPTAPGNMKVSKGTNGKC